MTDKTTLTNLIKKSDKHLSSVKTSKSSVRQQHTPSTYPETSSVDEDFFQQRLPQLYRTILQSFRKISKSFTLFNISFVSLFVFELLSLAVYTPFLTEPILLAVSLSALFLTIFSYFIFLFYLQARKPEQLISLKDQFLSSAHQLVGYSEEESNQRLCIAASLVKLATYLDDFEETLYRTPPIFSFLQKPLMRLSSYCHCQDVFRFKQILLNSAIDEHLHQIRATPTDLEAHASLANTYIALSKLFMQPKTPFLLRAYQKRKEHFEANFHAAAALAIEELQILNHYAPNDPWVHEQLATAYRSLQMPKEEIQEVETLLELRPHDKELLLRLGLLYFAQKSNAKGLKIYEKLKEENYKKAQDLIMTYGSSQQSRPFADIF